MATDLNDLVEPFKREVAVPGTFADTYPSTTDEMLAASLADAFGQAQLDGWFGSYLVDPQAYTVDPELSAPAQALVVVYAGMRLIRARIMELTTSTRYKAGPVEYETARSAAVLKDLLAGLTSRRDQLLTLATRASTSTYTLDAYPARASSLNSLYPGVFGVFAPAEVPYQPVMLRG